jgi:hypothetical protein
MDAQPDAQPADDQLDRYNQTLDWVNEIRRTVFDLPPLEDMYLPITAEQVPPKLRSPLAQALTLPVYRNVGPTFVMAQTRDPKIAAKFRGAKKWPGDAEAWDIQLPAYTWEWAGS